MNEPLPPTTTHRDNRLLDAILRDPEILNEVASIVFPPLTDLSPVALRSFIESHPAGGPQEAIIKAFGRPSFLVFGGRIVLSPSGVWRDRLESSRAQLEAATPSVGRVEIGIDDDVYLGTAWMIDDTTAVTNRHVAEVFARRKNGTFPLRADAHGRVQIDFLEEFDSTLALEHRVTEVIYIADQRPGSPDLAFIRVEGSNLPPPLSPYSGEVEVGQRVVTIGYPGFDPRNNTDDQNRIFDGIYNVKRVAPGQIQTVSRRGVFEHDASTLGGNSGSPILDLGSGQVVGLHFAGREGVANYAVHIDTVLREYHRHVGGTSVAVPLGAPDAEASPESVSSAADLWRRPGYQADFLDHPTPVPIPRPRLGALELHGPDGPTNSLRYQHFSVIMHAQRKLALLTAVNIDGSTSVRIKRGRDRWSLDPRLDPQQQLDDQLYVRNALDRGHLVRRLDPAWGDRARAEAAVRDTFYWTNCSPQHSDLNQRTWLGLEDYLLSSARTHGFRASVFTGPVFADDDPDYRGLTKLPQAYWKVAVMVADGQLLATGYVLSQAKLIEGIDDEFAFGGYRTYQVPIARIGRLAQLDFDQALLDADSMRAEGVRGGRVIDDFEDIVLDAGT